MGMTFRFLLAMAAVGIGTAIAAGHPGWGVFARVGILLLLLGAVIAAGVLAYRSRSENSGLDRRLASQKFSTGLVSLSSAAIVAVYAAGYHRTGAAADRIAQQTARRRTVGPIAASAIVVSAAPYRVEPSRTVPPPPTPTAPEIAKATKTPTRDTAVPLLAKTHNAKTAEPTAPPIPIESSNPPVEAVVLPTAVAPSNPTAAPAAPVVAKQVHYKDGTYSGWGSCRHGDIQASVVIQDGKIAATYITRCLTRYSCSWIAILPGQVVTRQSPEVDYISGATQSTDAFYGAVSEALSKARE